MFLSSCATSPCARTRTFQSTPTSPSALSYSINLSHSLRHLSFPPYPQYAILLLPDPKRDILQPSFRHSLRKLRFRGHPDIPTMYCFTFFSLVVVFVVSLICATPAESLRPYHRRRDLNGVRPVSDLGWKVPLQSGETHNKVKLIVSTCAHFLFRLTCTSSPCGRQEVEVPHHWSRHHDIRM